jgi:aminoglycoside phosphotransferase (APT) family kinase protein
LEALDATAVLARYEDTYRTFGAHRPVLELAFQHLRTHAPPMGRPVLLHGDFRTGNLVVDPERGIAAVLDWELAHRGDPAEDLGWLCVNSWRFGASSQPVGGFGAYEDLLSGYRAAGGEEIELSRVRYWQAVGSLKWAVMCLVMYDGWASGTAASVERPIIGRRVSEAEIDLLDLFEAGL